jgi:hypothetical protein
MKKKITKAISKTNLLVRVQARDGMFLGPDSFGGAVITIKDFYTNELIATGFTNNGDSGTRALAYNYNVSPSPIITPTTPIPTVYWLEASSDTVNYAADVFISQPTLVEITARIPLPPEQGDQIVTRTQWIIPKQNYNVGAGVVLEVPGLWVQPELITNKQEVKLRAKVTMMCGCEINDDSPWLPSDFVVTADIMPIGSSKKSDKNTVTLKFDVNSQFYAELPDLMTGEYEVQITARQLSTNNAGCAKKIIHISQ